MSLVSEIDLGFDSSFKYLVSQTPPSKYCNGVVPQPSSSRYSQRRWVIADCALKLRLLKQSGLNGGLIWYKVIELFRLFALGDQFF